MKWTGRRDLRPHYYIHNVGCYYYTTTRIKKVGVTGFEPVASGTQNQRSGQAELHPEKVFVIHFYQRRMKNVGSPGRYRPFLTGLKGRCITLMLQRN